MADRREEVQARTAEIQSVTRTESAAQDAEWLRCAADPAHFIDTYCWIEERHDATLGGTVSSSGVAGEVPFKLWDAQRETLVRSATQRYRVVLKARQLGFSWLYIARAVWRCLFRRSQLVICYSIGQDEANDLIHRAGFIYEHLPAWMQIRCPVRDGADAVSYIGWANGSTIKARAATKRAGRSFTASEVILDELGFMPHAKTVYDASMRAVEAGGELTAISTANGQGGQFYDLWQDAYTGLNDFLPIFLPWYARPGRNQAWYDAQLRNSNDPAIVQQEYPATPEEAFIASGRVRFNPQWIQAQSSNLEWPDVPRDAWPDRLRSLDLGLARNRLVIHELPVRGMRPIAGADCAEGIPGGNYDGAIGQDQVTGRHLWTLHGHWEPDEYAYLLACLMRVYGGTLVIERNNHGHAVILAVRKLMARPEFTGRFVLARGLDGRFGWVTSAQTRGPMLSEIARGLRDRLFTVRDRKVLSELADHRVLENGSTGPSEGRNDDLVFALAVIRGYLSLRSKARPATAGGGSLGNAETFDNLSEVC